MIDIVVPLQNSPEGVITCACHKNPVCETNVCGYQTKPNARQIFPNRSPHRDGIPISSPSSSLVNVLLRRSRAFLELFTPRVLLRHSVSLRASSAARASLSAAASFCDTLNCASSSGPCCHQVRPQLLLKSPWSWLLPDATSWGLPFSLTAFGSRSPICEL